ncbi:ion transporter [Hahella sp. SMD15-11]|uniref:Ion transporter n=1 Tax=Thermohahella caldifontis TaxID=3142973 RepID=A0AB39UZF7_9GAMM
MSEPRQADLRLRLYQIIFESDTPAGKYFDIALIVCILGSVLVVILDSVQALSAKWGMLFNVLEWIFTLLFTAEYLLRIYCTPQRARYIFSFWGLIDLVSVLPSYLAIFLPQAHYVLLVRIFRVVRVFRILRMVKYVKQAETLMQALRQGRQKILVFLCVVMGIVTVFGAIMYLVEGPEHGFTSIPRAMYWAIITLTTVGYGDITPQTEIGQFIASAVMLVGYAVIAVPTGIFTAELATAMRKEYSHHVCTNCHKATHHINAVYCDRCGHKLDREWDHMMNQEDS